MARPEAYDLSDAEKRDLIALIQACKPLPEKYRFLLFEDKRDRERVAELPHAAGSQARTDLRPAYLYETRPLHRGGEGDRHFRQRHHDSGAGQCGVRKP
jgi:hypothetical protein